MAVALAIAAVSVELCVSANLLTLLGVPYVTDGGPLPLKLHPGTDLLLLAGLTAAATGGRAWCMRIDPALLWFFAASAGCLMHILLLSGPSNMIVLLDTFLPAGILAAVLAHAEAQWRGRLRRVMQVLLAANAMLALAETVVQATLIPLYLDDQAYHPHQEDFRPTALFDHPLTGGIMAMIGLTLAPVRGWARGTFQILIWAALLAFGGRMALGVSLLSVMLLAAWRGARLVVARDPRAARSLAAAALAVLFASALLAGALAAGFGERLAGHLYWDSSAQARLSQWRILDQLDGWQLVFGTRREDLLSLLNGLHLSSGVEVLENFWLLMFVSLGFLGFPLFVAGFGALCLWCWRTTGVQARVLLVSVLVVASSSNSLGRKSTVLVCLVGGIASLAEAPRPRWQSARAGWPAQATGVPG
jgi:hypothetical protein